jgi:hypothetical protein
MLRVAALLFRCNDMQLQPQLSRNYPSKRDLADGRGYGLISRDALTLHIEE